MRLHNSVEFTIFDDIYYPSKNDLLSWENYAESVRDILAKCGKMNKVDAELKDALFFKGITNRPDS